MILISRNIGISPELESYKFLLMLEINSLTSIKVRISNVNINIGSDVISSLNIEVILFFFLWGGLCSYIWSTVMKYLLKHILENLLYLFAARQLLLDSPLDNNFIDYLQIRRQMLPQQKTCLLISKCYCSPKMAVRYLRFLRMIYIQLFFLI